MGNSNAKSILNNNEFKTGLTGTSATFSGDLSGTNARFTGDFTGSNADFSGKISSQDMDVRGNTNFNSISGNTANFSGTGSFGSVVGAGEGRFGGTLYGDSANIIGVGNFGGRVSGADATFSGTGSFGQSVTLTKGTANWKFNIKDDNSLCIANGAGENLVCIGTDGMLS